MKKRILKLIMKKLGVKDQEHFQFADQREEFIEYFFTLEALMRFNPETNEIKEPKTKNNDFKLVEIEEVEVIKNPYHNSNEKPKEDNVKTNIITKTEPAPSWLEYAIVENEHKFINWFDKLNALIKRKKYLKDE